jgi:hypothetical protein
LFLVAWGRFRLLVGFLPLWWKQPNHEKIIHHYTGNADAMRRVGIDNSQG